MAAYICIYCRDYIIQAALDLINVMSKASEKLNPDIWDNLILQKETIVYRRVAAVVNVYDSYL